jgi:hypothetical protein
MRRASVLLGADLGVLGFVGIHPDSDRQADPAGVREIFNGVDDSRDDSGEARSSPSPAGQSSPSSASSGRLDAPRALVPITRLETV